MINLGPAWTLMIVFGTFAFIPDLWLVNALIRGAKRWWSESYTAALIRSHFRRRHKPAAARRDPETQWVAVHHWSCRQ